MFSFAPDGTAGVALSRWRLPNHRPPRAEPPGPERPNAPAAPGAAPEAAGASPYGIPFAGGAGWVPVYGLIGLPAVGSVVRDGPNSTILPATTRASRAPA